MLDRAYLDIETSYSGHITVIGIFRPPDALVQMTYPDISCEALLNALDGAEEVITYWGHRFDLPVILKQWCGLLEQIDPTAAALTRRAA